MISALPAETAKPSSPGLVFADESLDYTEAMVQFVAASRDAAGLAPAASEPPAPEAQATLQAQKQALQREADALRVERRQTRAQRKIEDSAWKALQTPPRSAPALAETTPLADETSPALTRSAAAESRRSLRAQRRAQQKQRCVEDEHWRQQRRQLRARSSSLPLVSLWIAILVITDNCTRSPCATHCKRVGAAAQRGTGHVFGFAIICDGTESDGGADGGRVESAVAACVAISHF